MLYPLKSTLDEEEKLTALARALSSPVRVKILKLLRYSSMNVKEIALALDQPISSTALNVNILEQAGLILTEVSYNSAGKTRPCHRTCDKIEIILFDQRQEAEREKIIKREYSLPIGSFSSYDNITAPCGMTGKTGFMGADDDISLFFSPRRFKAALMWFSKGSVEYRISTPPPKNPELRLRHLELSFEACSEAPLYNNDYKSDITVWINDTEIGTWVCPGDFGGRRGQFNPPYWPNTHTQFGILANWKVTSTGTTMNDMFMSYVNLSNLKLYDRPYISVRIGVKSDARHCGGINIFGKDFGDFAQDIIVRFVY